MNSNLLQRLNVSSVTATIMRCTLPLAIVQILCVVLFFVWVFSL